MTHVNSTGGRTCDLEPTELEFGKYISCNKLSPPPPPGAVGSRVDLVKLMHKEANKVGNNSVMHYHLPQGNTPDTSFCQRLS